MLQLKNIQKKYVTAGFTQTALDGVSVSFRDNEFVAVLGPSGSGKTTMLNILGGLDHADDGDIVINGISTKDYGSKDWDTYRNHRVGFIFQSYNLIPHQSILSNVELALTLSGIGAAERKMRAQSALEDVGLGEHIHKKPAQLSGGQMQRVAIARALVNNPDIVLADEPTGALDTKTGIQIMELLKDIAEDRLVVMVTHNPELAEDYATRIVRLTDGNIVDDNDPFDPEAGIGMDHGVVGPLPEEGAKETGGKAGMSFLTALGLSFNNLMTKKGRTFLTAFAGSIGIIGIAAILALSTGVNNYIADTEEQAMTSYPLTVTKSSFDITKLMTASTDYRCSDADDNNTSNANSENKKEGLIPESTIMSDMFAQVKNNDLVAFKKFLESGESKIQDYTNTIQYNYGIEPQIYMSDTEKNGVVQLNPSSMSSVFSNGLNSSSLFSSSMSMSAFDEMLDNQQILEQTTDVVQGRWPEKYDETVLVLSKSGKISDYTLYSLGIYDTEVMEQMTKDVMAGNEVTVPKVEQTFTYDDAMNMTFKVVPQAFLYQRSSSGDSWTDMSKDDDYMKEQLNSDNAIELKVVGIVKPSDTTSASSLREGIAYLPSLQTELINRAATTDIVKDQTADENVDVFTGKTFEELQDDQKSNFDMSKLFTVDEAAMTNAFGFDTSALSGLGGGMDTSALSSAFDENSMREMMQNAPEFLPSSSLTDEQNEAAEKLMAEYTAWAIANPDKAQSDNPMQQFMATTEGQAAMQALTVVLGPSAPDTISKAVQNYMNQYSAYVSTAMTTMMENAASIMATQMAEAMSPLANLQNSFSFDASAFASAIKVNMSQEDMTSLFMNLMNSSELTYDSNLEKLGYASFDNPRSISIYPKDFAAKESVINIIDDYNDDMTKQGNDSAVIQYSDIAGALMSSVTTIVDTISMVLIAFVAISLVVSSIMIAIITYISVLERKKEIGILRAMGASKLNIANVFNAETIIEGLIAGVFAIAVVLLVSIPVNVVVESGFDVPNVMSLPWNYALILIAISVLLTFIAGLIPSSMASRRDPVEALRSE